VIIGKFLFYRSFNRTVVTENIQFVDTTASIQHTTNNIIIGTSSSQTLTGTSGNDTIDGRGGNDTINGGGGTDTAIVFDTSTNYTISTLNGVTRLTGLASADSRYRYDEIVLTNTENIQFVDTTVSIQPTTSQELFTIDPSSVAVNENIGSITFTITRSESAAAQTVYVSTLQNQGATNNGDYLSKLNEPVSFAVGEMSHSVTVQITDDTLGENDETFGLIVQALASDPVDIFLAFSAFTIQNDDGALGPITIQAPFNSNGQEIPVTQEPGATLSHTGPLYTSWDFALPYGWEILSVAYGIVVDIRETVPDGGPNAWPNSDNDNNPLNDDLSLGSGGIGNLVTIQHTVNNEIFYATYMHLQEGSVPIAIGDTVHTGQLLGLAGNTGTRAGTHFHFQVGSSTIKYGATNYGGWNSTSDNSALQTIANATDSEVGLITFDGYGSDLPESVIGTNGKIVSGSSGDDTIIGNSLDNTLIGGEGDDTLQGLEGNDLIDGGNGFDIAVMSHLASQYNYDSDILSGPEGSDSLVSIEAIGFGFDLGSSVFEVLVSPEDLSDPDGAGPDKPIVSNLLDKISDLYIAYFDRAPDAAGLSYWFAEIYSGSLTLFDTAKSFTDQPEYAAAYPAGSTNRDFIQTIYENLFDRLPDIDGWNYWENDLDNNGLPRDTFILSIINGAYDGPSAEDKALLNNKHFVSMYYAEQSSLHPEEGFDNNITAVLNEVGAAPNTVASAIDVIDYAMDNPITLTGIIQDEQLWDSFWIG